MANLFGDVPDSLPEELTEILARHASVRIERIVSRGHRSPDGFWYDQDEHEFVVVLSGSARLVFEGERGPMTLAPGDYVAIKPHERHRVEWTDPGTDTIWLAVFSS